MKNSQSLTTTIHVEYLTQPYASQCGYEIFGLPIPYGYFQHPKISSDSNNRCTLELSTTTIAVYNNHINESMMMSLGYTNIINAIPFGRELI